MKKTVLFRNHNHIDWKRCLRQFEWKLLVFCKAHRGCLPLEQVTKSAKRGKCVDINLEENRIYVLTSSLVVCTVTLQYIFFLILALAGDIEKNPGPMGIMHSFREIISRGAGHLSNRAGYVATQVACGWAWQGPYLRSLDRWGRSSEVKEIKS